MSYGGREGQFRSANHNIYNLVVPIGNVQIGNDKIGNVEIGRME